MEVKSGHVQMKRSNTERQSELISVQSGGDRETEPASVRPHREGSRIISTVSLIIVPNRRCRGSGTINPDGCPRIFQRQHAGEKEPEVKSAFF